MALYSPFKIMILCALFQAAAASHIEPIFHVVSGSCTVKGDGCVYSENFGTGQYSNHCVDKPSNMKHSNDCFIKQNNDCVIKQNFPFRLDVHSFDVEGASWDHHEGYETCSYDFLTVKGFTGFNGAFSSTPVKYCGTEGPQGVVPARWSELVWHTDYSVTLAGFKICAVSRQPPRHYSSGPWHKISMACTHAPPLPLRLAFANRLSAAASIP